MDLFHWKRIIWIALLFSIAAFAQEKNSIGKVSDQSLSSSDLMPALVVAPTGSYRDSLHEHFSQELLRYHRGENIQLTGRVMSWGGVGLLLFFSYCNSDRKKIFNSESPYIAGVGGLSIFLGIPVNGVGAGMMADAAYDINRSKRIDNWGGWLCFIRGGFFLGATGIAAYEYEASSTSSRTYKVLDDNFGLMILSGMIGAGFEVYGAWFQFSLAADRAKAHFNSSTSMVQVHLAPELIRGSNNGVDPGLQLSVLF